MNMNAVGIDVSKGKSTTVVPSRSKRLLECQYKLDFRYCLHQLETWQPVFYLYLAGRILRLLGTGQSCDYHHL